MCVIVHVPAGKELPGEDTLSACWRANDDGGGLMFFNEEGSFIDTFKSMSEGEFLVAAQETARKLDGKYDLTLHFRIGTCGRHDLTNVHPFYADPTGERQAALCHNGQLFPMTFHSTISDSHHFAKNIMSMCPPNWWNSEGMVLLFSEYVHSKHDKIAVQAIMDSGKPHTFLFGGGTWKNDIWYSNTHWERTYGNYNRGYGYGMYGEGYNFMDDDEFDWRTGRSEQPKPKKAEVIPLPQLDKPKEKERGKEVKVNFTGKSVTFGRCYFCRAETKVVKYYRSGEPDQDRRVCHECITHARNQKFDLINQYIYDPVRSGWYSLKSLTKPTLEALF